MDEVKIYKAVINPDIESALEVEYVALVGEPAINRYFVAFNKESGNPKRTMFALNEDKKIICGPAMIADMPIYRKDDTLGEYFVVFDKQQIQSIVEKFSAKGYLKKFNLFHNSEEATDAVTIFNSFISNKELGVPAMTGFEDLSDGTWYISAKINDDNIWQRIKSGEIKGFSVEGLFNYVPVKNTKVDLSKVDEEDLWFELQRRYEVLEFAKASN